MSKRRAEDVLGGEVLAAFVARLRAAMDGLSAREVGRRAGLHGSTVDRLCQGEVAPDLLTISKLERALKAELWPSDIAARHRFD